jgi:hypothetical protein
VLKRLRHLVADSASFPAHHSWGLSCGKIETMLR